MFSARTLKIKKQLLSQLLKFQHWIVFQITHVNLSSMLDDVRMFLAT